MAGSIAPDAAARASKACVGKSLDRSIGECFDGVAAANRWRIAIREPGGEISYGALASLSNRIAFIIGERVESLREAASPRVAVLCTLRLLAAAGAHRAVGATALPTLEELGIRGFRVEPWYGLVAPARTPSDALAKLRSGVAELRRMPEFQRQCSSWDTSPSTTARNSSRPRSPATFSDSAT